MSKKDLIWDLYSRHNIAYKKTDSYEKLANRLDSYDEPPFDVNHLRNYFRSKWDPCPRDFHIENLQSGQLQGHSWHGAMPSMLHLSLQNKVRDCIAGNLDLEELIEIGANIMKHEYFMVAAHDLLESEIIRNFPNTIPPIGNRSISDFVLNGVPYDLKNTNYFDDWEKSSVNQNKKEVTDILFRDADVARLRKQAQKSLNGWGLNRFYVMVEDQSRWILNPEGILTEVCQETALLGPPQEIRIEDLKIKTQIIAI